MRKKPRKRIVSFFIIVFFLLIQNYISTEQVDSANVSIKQEEKKVSLDFILDDLPRGGWLNKKYIKGLKASRSPQKAVAGVVVGFFVIKKKEGGYFMRPIYNFHDGGEEFRFIELKPTPKKHTYDLIVQVSKHTIEENNKFILIKRNGYDEIQWGYESNNKKKNQSFIRVEPNISSLVNRILLAGEYRDQNDRKFIFTESGLAKWPDKTFKYEVILDYIMGSKPCDTFMVVDEKGHMMKPPTEYGFFWKGDSLLIYRTVVDNEYFKCESTPMYILKRY